MILKVMTDFEADSYWLLDDIKKINRTGIFLKKDLPGRYHEGTHHDINLLMAEEEEQYTELICRGDHTDSEFSLITDCVIYVLNDHGKTIQRILPKY